MKPLWTLSILLTLLVALGCSKDDKAAGSPPSGEDSGMDDADESGGTDENMQPEGDPTVNTGDGSGDPSETTEQGANLNLPDGKLRLWDYATGQPGDLDLFFLKKPINILTNQLGMPSGAQASGQLGVGVWFYDKMKVDYQGTIYTKINVIVRQGQVIRITFDPRSEEVDGDDIDPATGSPIE